MIKTRTHIQASSGSYREIQFPESTLETIDVAMFNHVRNMGISALGNQGFVPVPLLWASAERAYQIRHNEEIRDASGSLILPLMSIHRTSVEKNLGVKGSAFGAVPEAFDEKGGSITVARRIEPKKTAVFTNAKAKQKLGQSNHTFKGYKKNLPTVTETISIPLPVYVTCMYSLVIKTEYEQQMNQILQPFITRPGGVNYFLIKSDTNHKYEAFIESDFSMIDSPSKGGTFGSTSHTKIGSEGRERVFEREVKIKVIGHLIGDGINQEKPKIVIRENAVSVKTPRENTSLGDFPDHRQMNRFGFREG